MTVSGFARALRSAALMAGAWYVGVYIALAWYRVPYPFELEWMEGAMVDHVIRVLSGQNLFVPPTIDFAPFIYNPLFYYLAAIPSLVLGASHLALRLVSSGLRRLISFASSRSSNPVPTRPA